MSKFLLATAAVIALASPALAANDNPAIIWNVVFADPGREGTVDGCKDHAVNVYSKAGGHDISLSKTTVWAVIDFEGHAYTASIFCKNDHGALAIAVAGAEEKGANAIYDNLATTWVGPKEEEAKADPKPTPKTNKHHKG